VVEIEEAEVITLPKYVGVFDGILKKPYRIGRLTRAQILESYQRANLSNVELRCEIAKLKRSLKRARAELRRLRRSR